MADADADEVTALLQLLATVPNVQAAVRAARHAVEAEGGQRQAPNAAVTRGARSFSAADEVEKPAASHERRIEALRRRLLLEEPDAPRKPPPPPPSDFTPTVELDLDALGTSGTGGAEADASRTAMAVLRETEGASAFERGALVKTIRNDFWHQFARALDRGDLSPCSLPPPGGAGMRLFGRAYSSSCGVVLSRKKLQLSEDVWCWPAGFFAKTEFATGRKKSESLDGRRDSFFVADELRKNAVPLAELERMAAKREYVHFGETRANTEVTTYNEVLAPVTRAAVVAVFARTRRPDHLLLAMAARDMLSVSTGTALPLLVLDAGGGTNAIEFSVEAQAGLIAKIAKAKPTFCLRPHADVPPLRNAPGALDAQLVAHGAYGLADDVLRSLLIAAPSPARATRDALAHAVRADNAEAARAVAQVVGADLATFASEEGCAPGPARHASDRCLVASGAVAALVACASGALAKRSRDAVALLDAWLEKADQSLAFRLSAYRDASKTAGDKEGSLHAPQLTAFAGGRALANRRAFRDRLASLGRSDGSAVEAAPAKLAELAALASSFHRPSLRLELLQFVLGLEDAAAWSVDRLAGALELAERVVVAMPRQSSFQELEGLTDLKRPDRGMVDDCAYGDAVTPPLL